MKIISKKSRYLVSSQSLGAPFLTSNKHFLYFISTCSNRSKDFALTSIDETNKIKNNK